MGGTDPIGAGANNGIYSNLDFANLRTGLVEQGFDRCAIDSVAVVLIHLRANSNVSALGLGGQLAQLTHVWRPVELCLQQALGRGGHELEVGARGLDVPEQVSCRIHVPKYQSSDAAGIRYASPVLFKLLVRMNVSNADGACLG